jgi:hypothetical protein
MATFQIKVRKYEFKIQDVQLDIPKYPDGIRDLFKKDHVIWMSYDRLAAWPMELGLSAFHYDSMFAVPLSSLKKAFSWNFKMPVSKISSKIFDEGSFMIFKDIEPYFFLKETGTENIFIPIGLLPMFVLQSERPHFTYDLFEWIKRQVFSDTSARTKEALDPAMKTMYFIYPIVYEQTIGHLARISASLEVLDAVKAEVNELKRRVADTERDNEDLRGKIRKIMN